MVMRECEKGSDGCISNQEELKKALSVWRDYQENYEYISNVFNKYDKDGSGKMDRDEMKQLLTDTNDGKEPTEEEISFVFSKADRPSDNDGLIDRIELIKAVSVWYARGEDADDAKDESKDTQPVAVAAKNDNATPASSC